MNPPMLRRAAALLASALLVILLQYLVANSMILAQDDIHRPEGAAYLPDSNGAGFLQSEMEEALRNVEVGFRTENPGPFLSWPLPAGIGATNISVIPDTPWTKNFLGIIDCPKYYPVIDDTVIYGHSYAGQFDTLALPGTTKDRARFQNVDDVGLFHNWIACYRATARGEWFNADGSTSDLPDHAGTDISAPNTTSVYAAAYADRIIVTYEQSQYRITLRHPNVNGSGQTWWTHYVHLSSSVYPIGPSEPAGGIALGKKIGGVGKYHLHFQASIAESYLSQYARNIWGIDRSPWSGCLWKDASLCPKLPTEGCCGCAASAATRGEMSQLGLLQNPRPPAPFEASIDLLVEPDTDVSLELLTATGAASFFSENADDQVARSRSEVNANSAAPVATAELIVDLPASSNFRLSSSVLSIGGGSISSNSYSVVNTIGQAYVPGISQSSSYQVRSGFVAAAFSGPAGPVDNPPTITPSVTPSLTPSATPTTTVTPGGPSPTHTITPTPTNTPQPSDRPYRLYLPVVAK